MFTDGYLDLFAANGHIEEEIGRVQPKVQYRQPPLLFHNLGGGKFENVSAAVGEEFTRPQWSTVRSGSSYCSQSGLALTFGLGPDTVVSSLEIQWPSGVRQRFTNIAANQFVKIDEIKGIVASDGKR